MATYILYYSQRDRVSSQMYQDMLNMPSLLELTQMVDVDKERVPSYVTVVPMLVIKNENRALVGTAAIQWLERAKDKQCCSFDASGTMGGRSLGYSEIEGSGYITSQQGFSSCYD